MSKFAVNVTVIVFVPPDTGVLCRIDLTLKVGTATVNGSAPLATPYSAVPGFTIAADAMVADPEAAIFTAGDVVAAEGFVIWNPNVYVVPVASVPPLFTVSVNVPELHAPFPCVVPSENVFSPSSPASKSVTGLVATPPVNPDIVTIEFAAAVRSVSDTSVTVIVFDAPATGLLWPMAFVVNDCASTDRELISKMTNNSSAYLKFELDRS